jgi:hypothetical protein
MAQFIWALLGHQKIQDDRTCTLPRTPFLDNFLFADDTLGTQFSRNLNLAECLRWVDAQ